jgi:hypothetical protein
MYHLVTILNMYLTTSLKRLLRRTQQTAQSPPILALSLLMLAHIAR